MLGDVTDFITVVSARSLGVVFCSLIFKINLDLDWVFFSVSVTASRASLTLSISLFIPPLHIPRLTLLTASARLFFRHLFFRYHRAIRAIPPSSRILTLHHYKLAVAKHNPCKQVLMTVLWSFQKQCPFYLLFCLPLFLSDY